MFLIDAVPRNRISAIKGKDLTNIKCSLKFDVTKIRLDRNTLSISSLNSKRTYTRVDKKKATSPVVASYLAGALEKQGANLEHVFLLAHNLRIDMKIREFNYKFICNRLATGEWLYRVGITNSNVCTFCSCEKETVEHLFIKCDTTKTFWEKYSEWRYNASRKPENLTMENIMLGISMSELPVEENLCLLYAKYFIYGCKYREQKPSFSNFIKYLESKHNVEMYIEKKNNQIEEQRKRWGCVYKYFH